MTHEHIYHPVLNSLILGLQPSTAHFELGTAYILW